MEIGHSGSIYTADIGKCHKNWGFFGFPRELICQRTSAALTVKEEEKQNQGKQGFPTIWHNPRHFPLLFSQNGRLPHPPPATRTRLAASAQATSHVSLPKWQCPPLSSSTSSLKPTHFPLLEQPLLLWTPGTQSVLLCTPFHVQPFTIVMSGFILWVL